MAVPDIRSGGKLTPVALGIRTGHLSGGGALDLNGMGLSTLSRRGFVVGAAAATATDPLTMPEAGVKYFSSAVESAQPELVKTENLLAGWVLKGGGS